MVLGLGCDLVTNLLLQTQSIRPEKIRLISQAKQQTCFCPNDPNNPITFTLKALKTGHESVRVLVRPIRDTQNMCGSTNKPNLTRMLLEQG